jgi:hypothetical protein
MNDQKGNLIADMAESGVSMSGVQTREECPVTNVAIFKSKRAADDIFVRGGNPILTDVRRIKAEKELFNHTEAGKRLAHVLALLGRAYKPFDVQLIDESGITGFRIVLSDGQAVTVTMPTQGEGA